MMSMTDLSGNGSGMLAEVAARVSDDFGAALKEATSRIERVYFKVDRADGSSVNRERVYCYELYHQLRTHGNFGLELTTHAEIDKSRQDGYKKENPDFLIHKPGSHEDNFLIMEVKVSASRVAGWAKDIRKIAHFMKSHHYKRGIFLLFGSDPEPCLRKPELSSQELAKPVREDGVPGPSKEELSKIEVWWHKAVGSAAERLPNPWGEEGIPR